MAIEFKPMSFIAASFETIATFAACANPATAPYADKIGMAIGALVGGVELNDDEKNIKEKLDKALDIAWVMIDRTYRISSNSEKCFSELKGDIIGKGTSVEQFVRNLKIKGLKDSISMVIQTILERYKEELNRDPEVIWDDDYRKKAANDMASIIVGAMNNVLNDDDLLKTLKAIQDSEDKIIKAVDKKGDQILEEIQKYGRTSTETLISLTDIPAGTEKLIGREEDIQVIYELLKYNNIVCIHADGGIGKTAVATKIANEVKLDIESGNGPYKHVAWITSTGNLKNDLTRLYNPSVASAQSEEEKFNIVYKFLRSDPSFLVIDNMDELPTEEEVNKLNTIAGKTKILITSRACIPHAEEYLLNNLNLDSALIMFYLHFSKKKMTLDQIKVRDDFVYGKSIVEVAAYNALFIELIGDMAYADYWRLKRLWEKISTDVFGIDSRHPIKAGHGNDGKLLDHIRKLYEMSKLSERQKEIMLFVSLFPAEQRIFFDVFDWAGFINDEEDNLGALQERGWIVRDEEGYLIHTIVKGSIQQQNGKSVFDEDRFEELINQLVVTDRYMPGDMPYTEVHERIAVLETVCKMLIDNGSEALNTSALYNSMAGVYKKQWDYTKALKYYMKALEIREKLLGTEHIGTASIYNNIALAYRAQGDYSEAMKYLMKALTICERVLGMENQYTATTYSNIASVYKDMRNYSEALKYFSKALEIREKVQDTDCSSTATDYNNIALMYYEQENYSEALKFYKKALEINEKVLGTHHPDTAAMYSNLAGVYFSQGNYSKALMYFEKTLEIFKEVLGTDHPDTARTYHSIACVYYAQGEYAKTLNYLIESLAILEKVLGTEHPEIATIYKNMADAYQNLRDYTEALKCYKKVLAIDEKVRGANYQGNVSTCNYIAGMYFAQGEYAKSKMYCEKALAISEKVLGRDHPDTKTIRQNLDYILQMIK